jgi:SAM-dependent methyltransferase
MSETQATSYDEVPYGNYVFPYTHPETLATVASLFGLSTAPVRRCRVLELGCGTGSNLLPMAQDLPDSRFVGIDLSARQIDMGQEVARALGLPNLELRAASIMDVDARFGEFDYILCHGVYSWVPPEVQDKVLAVCRQNLAPHGVAYVSYNTYPGWHIRGMIREMMCFHALQFDDPAARVGQARALLELLRESVGDAKTVYGSLLQIESDLLEAASDTYRTTSTWRSRTTRCTSTSSPPGPRPRACST